MRPDPCSALPIRFGAAKPRMPQRGESLSGNVLEAVRAPGSIQARSNEKFRQIPETTPSEQPPDFFRWLNLLRALADWSIFKINDRSEVTG